MTTPTRQAVIKANEAITRGNARKPTKLDDGEVTFRIPTRDWQVLRKLFPTLEHPDNSIRLASWKAFRHDPIAKPYLVVRSPNQVKRSNQ